MKIDPRSPEERTERWLKDARNILALLWLTQILMCVGVWRG